MSSAFRSEATSRLIEERLPGMPERPANQSYNLTNGITLVVDPQQACRAAWWSRDTHVASGRCNADQRSRSVTRLTRTSVRGDPVRFSGLSATT